MSNLKVFDFYIRIHKIIFASFLFMVLAFGRAFSVVHIDIVGIPLYVTEAMLIFSLPLFPRCFKKVILLPRLFFFPLTIYFIIGCCYLLAGLFNHNLFVLRDIVLFVYILFFALVYLQFSDSKSLRYFLIILFSASVINLFLSRFFVLDFIPEFPFLKNIILNLRPTNIGLYSGISMSFLFSILLFKCFVRYKPAIIFLLFANLYFCVFLATRTIWFACLMMFVYFFLLFKMKFVKVFLQVVLVTFFLSLVLHYFDFVLISGSHQKMQAKVRSTRDFLKLATRTESFVGIVKDESTGVDRVVRLTEVEDSEDEETESFEKKTIRQKKHLNKKQLKEKFIQNFGNIIWRLDVWKQYIKFAWKSPIFGRGFGNHPPFMIWNVRVEPPKTIGADSGVVPSHCHIISILYKMGLLGLGLFTWVNVFVFCYALNTINKLNSNKNQFFLVGALGSFIFWHSMAFLFDIIDSPPTSIFLWVVVGLIFSALKVGIETEK